MAQRLSTKYPKKWKRFLFPAIIISLLPYFLFYLNDPDILGTDSRAIANLTGLVAGTLLLWQYVLGLRFVSRQFSEDYISVVRFHIFIGTFATALVFLHPLMQVIALSWPLSYIASVSIATPYDTYLLFGKLAILIFTATWITSAVLRSRLSYRLWHRLHYLNHVLILFVFIHSLGIGTLLKTYPVLRAYWLALFAVYLALVAWRLLRYLNVGRARYKLVDKKALANGVVQYTLEPLSKKIIPSAGQFVFVRHSFFSEVHPFSVMEFNEKTGQIKFGIKKVGKYTNQLASLPIGKKFYLEGPYGVFTQEGHSDDPKVVIAGGIGVTPFVELVKRYSNEKTHLIYSNRELKNAVKRDEFKRQLKANYADVISDEKTNEPVVEGLVDKTNLKKLLPNEAFTKSRFFLCGPPAFMASVIKSLQDFGVSEDRIFLEEFNF